MNPEKNILLFGAGKSATELITFLITACGQNQWRLIVVDAQADLVRAKTQDHPLTTAIGMDIQAEAAQRLELIRTAGVVISMLPPALHQLIAADCLEAGAHLLTASYVDPQIRAMAPAIREKGLLFLCEMGLDPGIDHMSAMRLVHGIREKGGQITAFYSHCGGLIAPESDDNPWHYKISWNPRNVVMAGIHGARFREDGVDKQISYENLFDPTRQIPGPFAWYPNRDSLEYTTLYGLEDVPTFIRTTLRHPAFVSGWKNLIKLNLTDDTPAYDTTGMTQAGFFRAHCKRYGIDTALDYSRPLAEQLKKLLTISPEEATLLEQQLLCLGWNSTDKVKIRRTADDLIKLASAADILQVILECKLALKPEDKDMIVMRHEIRYAEGGGTRTLQSNLVVKGHDAVHTAMARTVGLPLGIAAVLVMQDKLRLRGLQIPIVPEIYLPVLEELEKEGIVFDEHVI